MFSKICQRPYVQPKAVVKPAPTVWIRRNHEVNRRPKSLASDIGFATHIVGKGIILFTMFYCSLNWLHYRELNKENDTKTKGKKENETKK